MVRPCFTVDTADAFERGRARGAWASDAVRRSWPIYQQLFEFTARDVGRRPVDVAAVAEACLDAVSVWSPSLLRELEGVAAGAGLDLATVMALNARTEVLALARGVGATECSTIVQLTGGPGCPVAAQTWDWHADLADSWHLQSVGGDTHRFVGLSEFGMLAKIGVNDAGVAVHFNLLRHASDVPPGYDDQAGSPLAGVPVHLLAREVLGRAGDLAEAVDLLRSAPVAASSVLTVITEDEAACLEVAPAGVAVVEPVDGWLVHTNHFLDPGLADGERVTIDVSTTFERREVLTARVKGVDRPLDGEGLVGVLDAHDAEGAVCRHVDPAAPFGYRTATLATVALDPVRRTAAVSADGPCRRSAGVERLQAV